MAKSWTIHVVSIALVAAVAGATAGCSTHSPVSSGGTVKAITAADMPALAGTWQGTMSGATGNSFAATAVVNANGTYTLQGGPFHSTGKTAVKDGRLEFAATGGGTGRADDAGRGADGVRGRDGRRWQLGRGRLRQQLGGPVPFRVPQGQVALVGQE